MKLGIAISVIILIVFGFVLYIQLNPEAEPPSAKVTAEGAMQASTLPDDLPELYEETPGGDSSDAYQAAFDFFAQNRYELERNTPDPQTVAAFADRFIAALPKGPLPEGHIDQLTPMKLQRADDVRQAILSSVLLVVGHSDRMLEAGKRDEAVKAATALFAFGKRLYDSSVRLDNRRHGLEIMGGALQQLSFIDDNAPSPERLDPWFDAVNKQHQNWEPKLLIFGNIQRPPAPDLLYIAEHDEDRSMRIEAVRLLAVAKFNAQTKGNLNAIEAAIAKYKESDDPLIAEAAREAEAFTVEDLHKAF